MSPAVSRKFLDRLQRQLGPLGLPPQPRCAGPKRDHADRVAGGVVEVTSDPGALLRSGEATLAFRLVLGAQGALSQIGEVLAPQARPLAGEPSDRPREARMNQLGTWETAVTDRATDRYAR